MLHRGYVDLMPMHHEYYFNPTDEISESINLVLKSNLRSYCSSWHESITTVLSHYLLADRRHKEIQWIS